MEMRGYSYNPPPTIFVSLIESYVKSRKVETALRLLEMHFVVGQIDTAMKLYNSMTNVGLRHGLSTYIVLLTLLVNKKFVDMVAKILLEMKAMGYYVHMTTSDVLMVYIKEGSIDLALR